MFVKNYLQSYSTKDYMVLKDDTDFDLVILRVWLFGLFKTKKKIKFTLSDRCDWASFFKLWDSLILEQKSIKI